MHDARSDAYDILIIGAGQCGIPLARRLAQEKWRVAIAERRHLGGSCVNFGCTPTKAVVASARVAHLARRAADFGVTAGDVRVDLPAVLRRARTMVEKSVDSLKRGLDEAGVEVIRGHARFVGRDGDGYALTVGDRRVTAARVIIDVGTRSTIPPIDGLADINFIHAGNWLAHDTLPRKLVIAGAGYIGLEMAQFYRRCGAEVCVVGSGECVADREDVDVSDGLQGLLEREGVRFVMNAKVKAVAKAGDGLRVTLADEKTLDATHLFLATGRTPNTDDLGLESIGLRPNEKGTIEVNDRLETGVKNVWAAGDVRGGPMFTHASWDDHRVLESQLLGDGKHTTAGRIIPYAIFTDPELGRVGLSEAEAREKHDGPVKVATFKMNDNGKANQQGEADGFIKLIADPKTDRLLGAAVLASEGAELLAAYITLMNAGVSLAAICRAIFVHPTLAEAVQSAVSALDLGVRPTDA